jgi:hypothetical protein
MILIDAPLTSSRMLAFWRGIPSLEPNPLWEAGSPHCLAAGSDGNPAMSPEML